MRGPRSTPGRYFQVAQPGLGWGGTDITDPLAIIEKIDPKTAWPGLRLLLTRTTGEDALYCVLDDTLRPVPAEMPAAVRPWSSASARTANRRCARVLFMAGAGGSLRPGVTENPVLLTRSVARGETRVTMGGAPVYLWPGGGITVMADVLRMPGRLRLRADAGDRRPDRIHPAPRACTSAGRPCRFHPAVESIRNLERVKTIPWTPAHPWPLTPQLGAAR